MDSAGYDVASFFAACRGENQAHRKANSYSRREAKAVVEQVMIFAANRLGCFGYPAGGSFVGLLGSVSQIVHVSSCTVSHILCHIVGLLEQIETGAK